MRGSARIRASSGLAQDASIAVALSMGASVRGFAVAVFISPTLLDSVPAAMGEWGLPVHEIALRHSTQEDTQKILLGSEFDRVHAAHSSVTKAKISLAARVIAPGIHSPHPQGFDRGEQIEPEQILLPCRNALVRFDAQTVARWHLPSSPGAADVVAHRHHDKDEEGEKACGNRHLDEVGLILDVHEEEDNDDGFEAGDS